MYFEEKKQMTLCLMDDAEKTAKTRSASSKQKLNFKFKCRECGVFLLLLTREEKQTTFIEVKTWKFHVSNEIVRLN